MAQLKRGKTINSNCAKTIVTRNNVLLYLLSTPIFNYTQTSEKSKTNPRAFAWVRRSQSYWRYLTCFPSLYCASCKAFGNTQTVYDSSFVDLEAVKVALIIMVLAHFPFTINLFHTQKFPLFFNIQNNKCLSFACIDFNPNDLCR